MSPEVLRGDGYDFKSDIWSLGCLLYEFAMLKSPFKSEGLNLYSLFQKISKGDYQPVSASYSTDLQSLVTTMLSGLPEDRPDINQTCEVASRLRFLTSRRNYTPETNDKLATIDSFPLPDEAVEKGGEDGPERPSTIKTIVTNGSPTTRDDKSSPPPPDTQINNGHIDNNSKSNNGRVSTCSSQHSNTTGSDVNTTDDTATDATEQRDIMTPMSNRIGMQRIKHAFQSFIDDGKKESEDEETIDNGIKSSSAHSPLTNNNTHKNITENGYTEAPVEASRSPRNIPPLSSSSHKPQSSPIRSPHTNNGSTTAAAVVTLRSPQRRTSGSPANNGVGIAYTTTTTTASESPTRQRRPPR